MYHDYAQALILGCGHCKHLAPEFIKAAEELEKDGIKLAQVDCTQHQDLCKDIRGYPTMKIYKKDGNHSMYEGSRNSDGIIKFMRKYYSLIFNNSFLGKFRTPSPL